MEKEDDSKTGSTTGNGKPLHAADRRRDTYMEHRLEERDPKPPDEHGQSSPKARPPGTQLYGGYGIYLPPMYNPYTTPRQGSMYNNPYTFGYYGYNGTEDDSTGARTGTNKTYPNNDPPPYRCGRSSYGGYTPPYNLGSYGADTPPYNLGSYGADSHKMLSQTMRRAKQEDNPPPAHRYSGRRPSTTSRNVATSTKQKVEFHIKEPAMVGDEELRDGARRRRAYVQHLQHMSDGYMSMRVGDRNTPAGGMSMSGGYRYMSLGGKNKQPHDKSTAESSGKNDSVTGLVSRGKLFESESEDEDDSD